MHDSRLEDADETAAPAPPHPLPSPRPTAQEPADAPAAMPAEIAATEPAAVGAIDEQSDAPRIDPEPEPLSEPPPLAAAHDATPGVALPTASSSDCSPRLEQETPASLAGEGYGRTAAAGIVPSSDASDAAHPDDPATRRGPRGSSPDPSLQAETGAASALLTEVVEARETRPQKWPARLAEWTPTLARLARYAALALAAWLALVVVLVALFRFVDPPGSMLMLLQRLGGTPITMSWRDLDDISPELVRAVVASEDSRVCEHWGIDLDEIANAIRRTRDGTPRGASTISMQVAKNLFLWPSKSYFRKALEVPVTLAIEVVWPKRRIVEVYLNIAEWGPGVFGAEAAARHHFAKPAKRLSARESALLAVSLPNPALRNAGKPSRMVSRLASLIERRAKSLGSATRCLAP